MPAARAPTTIGVDSASPAARSASPLRPAMRQSKRTIAGGTRLASWHRPHGHSTQVTTWTRRASEDRIDRSPRAAPGPLGCPGLALSWPLSPSWCRSRRPRPPPRRPRPPGSARSPSPGATPTAGAGARWLLRRRLRPDRRLRPTAELRRHEVRWRPEGAAVRRLVDLLPRLPVHRARRPLPEGALRREPRRGQRRPGRGPLRPDLPEPVRHDRQRHQGEGAAQG